MENIYIRNRNEKDKILLCNEKYEPIREEGASGRKTRNCAFYVNFPGGFIGAYSSPSGPILFINKDKYLFTDTSWAVTVKKGDEINEVKFEGVAQGKCEFRYPAANLDPVIDPWYDEQMADFYIWLANSRDNPGFIRTWTE